MALKQGTVLPKTQGIIDFVNLHASASNPVTVRRMYYALVTAGIIPSSDKSYKNLKALLSAQRKAGTIPYESFIDSVREAVETCKWYSLEARASSAHFIHLNPWIPQDNICEIIIEKDAAQPLIESACSPMDVTIRCLRGDASLSFLYSTARDYNDYLKAGKAIKVGCWSDFDGGGISIIKAAERSIREILSSQFGVYEPDLKFTRLGITKEQFVQYHMLPIPGKSGDSKLKAFIEEFGVDHGAEIDALPEEAITGITENFIEECIDKELWKQTKTRLAEDESKWHTMLESIA